MDELLNITENKNNQNDIASRFDCQVILPYYEQDGITIYNADCRTVMQALRPSWIVTDPPYGINYKGINESKRKGLGVKFDSIINDDGNLNLEFIFRAEGNKVVFGAENYYNILPSKGSWIVWDKRVDEKCDKMFGNPIEMAWNSLEGLHKIYRIQHGGVVNEDGGKRQHPTQKPVRLFYRILEDLTEPDDLILDPFMGSGTTLIAAQKLGRKAVGIEIDKHYCDIAIKRLAQMELF